MGGQSDRLEQLLDLRLTLLARKLRMDGQRIANYVADGAPWIERPVGILEDHLDLGRQVHSFDVAQILIAITYSALWKSRITLGQ